LLTYFFEETKFGKFPAEKLDTEHILTGKINYPMKAKRGIFIRFSFGKQNTKQEIDLLISSIKKLINKT
jgi:cysteine sulfinate desulfinase/cysteine desulfurase-like protein